MNSKGPELNHLYIYFSFMNPLGSQTLGALLSSSQQTLNYHWIKRKLGVSRDTDGL